MQQNVLKLTVVVPCYNEESRLPTQAFIDYLASGAHEVQLLFVDDGSTDQTVQLLQRIAAAAPAKRAAVLSLGNNQGKAEAVRRGMLQAIEAGDCDIVGFWDSDLATPLAAIADLAAELRARPAMQMVFGARVALLGRDIRRSAKRHYLGRVFATLASLVLELPIYDTQCGAKLFRATPHLTSTLSTPFLTRWVFDVEMIARFAALAHSSGAREGPGSSIVEYPLHHWMDVAGSKLKPFDILKMAYGLLLIRNTYFLREWPGGGWREDKVTEALALVGAVVMLVVLMLCILGMLIHAAIQCH